ncbi:hypothetical protein BBJ28_00021933 [Nothophytophthora sp. Chile5]|nr:hypothetical protein BBJ28_00021933 [Nothophytophthora sp. Chile5]
MINHAPLYPGAKDPTDKQPVQHPCRTKHDAEYNIVTNIPHPGTGMDTVPASTTSSPSRKQTREFSIITNKYDSISPFADRFEQEAAQAKRLAAQKYFKTRTFDPVRVAYVDEERETDFLSRRRGEQQAHGKDRALLLPPREQFSEGRLYNILNQQVINPGKLATSTENDQRALNKIQKTAFEKKMRVLGESEQARETDLCLNRFAHERHTESYVHGYDVLSNQPYVGRDAKLKVPTRTHAALTSWQAIESGLPAGNKIAPKPSSTFAVAANIRTPPSNPPTRRANHDDVDTRKPNILIVQQLTDAPQV